jgi:hypothetical protein
MAADMHWNATDERYCEALRHLAIALLMLAGVAENAYCRSWPMRSLMLLLLTRAETRVRGFGASAGIALSPADCRASPAGGEAARLARGFRALATAFFALACRACHQSVLGRRHRRSLIRRRNIPRLGRLFVAEAYADTS